MQGIELTIIGMAVTEPRFIHGTKSNYWEFNVESRGIKDKPYTLTLRCFETDVEGIKEIQVGTKVACYCSLMGNQVKNPSRLDLYATYIVVENIVILSTVRGFLRSDRNIKEEKDSLQNAYKLVVKDLAKNINYIKTLDSQKLIEYICYQAFPKRKAREKIEIFKQGEKEEE